MFHVSRIFSNEYILNVNITSNSEAFFVDINKPELNFLELYRQFFKRKWEMLQGSFDYRVLNILRVVYQLHCLSHRHPTASTYQWITERLITPLTSQLKRGSFFLPADKETGSWCCCDYKNITVPPCTTYYMSCFSSCRYCFCLFLIRFNFIYSFCDGT